MKWQPEVPDLQAQQRLMSGLGLVQHGCQRDFVTRIIPRSEQGQVDSGRSKVAEDFHRFTECELHPALVSAELHQRSKHGTYSRRPPFSVPDDTGISMEALVRRYFEPHGVSLSGASLHYADEAVRRLYDVGKGLLNLASLHRAELSFLGRTGLGWPVFSADRRFLGQIHEASERLIRSGYPRDSVHFYPGVVGFRGQPRGPGRFCKFRAIYQCSRVIGNLEKMLQIPVLNALKDHPSFSAWVGRAAVNQSVTRLLRSSKRPLVSIDFSNFDASIPFEVIRRVFSIMKGWFHRSWHPHVEYLSRVFCGCGIFIPCSYLEGEGRLGGVPSGSVLTNLIDSLVNLWVVHYSAHRTRGHVIESLVQGDDGVYRFVGTNHSQISRVLLSDLGMVLSVEKSLVSSSEVHFLQNVFSKGYLRDGLNVGVRPLMRVLNGMMSYEDINRRWDKTFDSFRWLQQLENASDHPSFNRACQWLLEHDDQMDSVIGRILSRDSDLLMRARLALSGKHEWGKVGVDGISASRAFAVMLELSGRKVA